MYNDKELAFFDRHGKKRPEHLAHGEDTWENPASARLEKMQLSNWKLEGNKLTCDTPNGPLVQFIPTDRIMKGTDSNGYPIFEKIALQ